VTELPLSAASSLMHHQAMYPRAERLDLVDELHGHLVPDPYRWLEDADDPATQQWSAEQDALVEAARAEWPMLASFRAELSRLFSAGEVSSPVWRRARSFESRRPGGAELYLLLTTDPDGTERVLFDPIAIDPTGTTTLDQWHPSPDGNLVAYQLSHGGTEFSELFVLDAATGSIVDGPIDRVRYTNVAWLPSGEAFYYVRHLAEPPADGSDAALYRRVHLHHLGADPATDPVVFGAGSARGTYFSVSVSADGRYLSITGNLGTDHRNDAWLADLAGGDPATPDLQPIQVGVDARVFPYVRAGVVYLQTDRDAPRGRICACLPDALAYDQWRELVAEDPVAVLDDFVILDGAEISRPLLVVARKRHSVSELTRHDLATGARLGTVDLPGLGTVDELTARPIGGREAWFSYTDYATPSTVYRLDGRTGEVDVWRSAADPVALVTTQATCTSLDGTPVHLFVVEQPGRPAGPAPTILYGYGGFGIGLTPGFSPSITAWVRAGGVYAVANLRGGNEEGEQWHRAGLGASKQNVFDDYHACAQWLLSRGVATPASLGLRGGSNGGLLVGAALTQHPQTCAAVVCSAPLLDMLRYERFSLGSTWAGEYGHAANPEEFEWLYGYSPYHHVTDGVAYPAVLFAIFDSDTRVDPLHARKMAAALQHATIGGRPILVRREAQVGHAGRAVSRSIGLICDELSFLAAQLGLGPKA
jgi:prolyl oligopeptidase